MSNHHTTDLSRTVQELLPRRQAMWQNMTKATVWVSAAVAGLLLILLLWFVIL